MTITYGLMERLEDIAETNDGRAKIMLKTKVEKLITDANGNVCGVEAVNNKGERIVEKGPVIITTGGFGADFTDNSLLNQYRPDLAHLPTTNGEHCTGDGLKMSMAVGAETVDLEWVQVHPTGLVHPMSQMPRSNSLLRRHCEGLVECSLISPETASAMSWVVEIT